MNIIISRYYKNVLKGSWVTYYSTSPSLSNGPVPVLGVLPDGLQVPHTIFFYTIKKLTNKKQSHCSMDCTVGVSLY